MLSARVFRESKEVTEVLIDNSGRLIKVPLSTNEIVIKVSGDVVGNFSASVDITYFCTMKYYVSKPTYIPYTTYKIVTIFQHYLNLGNSVLAITLVGVGLALILIANYIELIRLRTKNLT